MFEIVTGHMQCSLGNSVPRHTVEASTTSIMVPYSYSIVTVSGTSNRLQNGFGNYSGPSVPEALNSRLALGIVTKVNLALNQEADGSFQKMRGP